MTPKHGTGLRYMEMTDESYFRISWRYLHKNSQIGDLGEVRLLPIQSGFCPPRRIPLAVDGGKQTTKRASLTLDQLRLQQF